MKYMYEAIYNTMGLPSFKPSAWKEFTDDKGLYTDTSFGGDGSSFSFWNPRKNPKDAVGVMKFFKMTVSVLDDNTFCVRALSIDKTVEVEVEAKDFCEGIFQLAYKISIKE